MVNTTNATLKVARSVTNATLKVARSVVNAYQW